MSMMRMKCMGGSALMGGGLGPRKARRRKITSDGCWVVAVLGAAFDDEENWWVTWLDGWMHGWMDGWMEG